MNKQDIEQANEEVIRYYHALKPFLRSIKNLIISIPELTIEDKQVIHKVNEYQPLDEIVADFTQLTKWKKIRKGQNNIYINSEKIILTNNEFLEFVRTYRNNIDDTILEQISENEQSEYTLEAYKKYNKIIRELNELNNAFRKTADEISMSKDNKNNIYLQTKQEENIMIIREIKNKIGNYKSSNNSLEQHIKFDDEYIKILSDARREMNLLIIEMHNEIE